MQLSSAVVEANLGFGGIGWIAWIVIGGIAGWLASKIMGTDAQQGLLLNIVVGIIGGVIGGIVLRFLGVSTAGAGWILTLLTALAGACALLFVVGLVTGRRR
ncbi:GlsB/YeaQ/YmgE family stress response membrane protein [Tsukamurella ocularis]|uniref:GlsB/YeaQ/YmgE family stress response membrane protein n=1 Tax=Tsukamurella ocularis TaxID=1970234 RepID=UPI0039EDFC08